MNDLIGMIPLVFIICFVTANAVVEIINEKKRR